MDVRRSATRLRVLAAAGAATLLMALLPTIPTAPTAAVEAPQSTLPSANPVDNTPRVTNGQVRAIARAGDTVYVGGSYTTVQNGGGGTNQTRNRLFSYRHSTGQVDAWNPNLNGAVEAAVLSPDLRWLYVGGSFTTIGGASAPRLERFDTATGTRDATFNPNVNGVVNDLELRGNVLYLGGGFTSVNGTSRQRLAAVNATTGATLALNLPVTPAFSDGTTPNVKKLDVTPAGDRLVAIGNFRAVAGADRPQLAVVNLDGAGGGAVATDFRTSAFAATCASVFDTYMRDVEFSPDGTWFGVNTTGAWNGTSTYCDTTTRFETRATGSDVRPTWADYTGGDTLYAIAVTDAAVYVGGHQRWQNNSTPPGGDTAGPGAVSREGIAALDPLTGLPLSWNPGRQRGVGVFDILTSPDALFIGHDTNLVAGETRPRLTAFPMTTATNPSPDLIGLPVTLFQGRSDGSLRRGTLDGYSVSAVTSGPLGGVDWSSMRAAFVQRGQLYAWGLPGGTFTRRSFDGTTVGTPTDLIAAARYVVGPPDHLTDVRAAAYANGRLFYLRDGDNRLFWRWFALESGVVGASEFVASSGNWSTTTGIEVAGNWLYATRTDGRLYRAYVLGGSVSSGNQVLVDQATNWSGGTDLFMTGLGNTLPDPPPPGGEVTCASDEWRAQYFANTDLSGLPSDVRCEASVDGSWGDGSPEGTSVGPDQFSVRWTTTLTAAEAGTYRFDTVADDGIRVDVDGVRILDEWRDQAPTAFTARRDLTAGTHQVVVEYYENGGGAEVHLGVTFDGAPPEPTSRVGLVVPSPTALGSDALLRDHLAADGTEVVVLDDSTVDATAVAGLDAVVISGRIQSGAVGTRLNTTTVPLVVAKAWFQDDLRMTAGGSSQGTVSTTAVQISDPSNPLAGGLSGTVQIYGSAALAGFGTPTAGGSTAATVNGRSVVWGYLPGAVMAGGTVAAGCRLALPFEGDVAANLTAAGWTLLDASLARARSTACAP